MTTNATTHHAIKRLLDIMEHRDSISASTAAEILGEGEDRARHFVREVAERKMASWSHSPSEGAPARYIDHYNGTERDLPPVTADTTPDSVLLDCKDVLWLLCVKDVAKQTKVRLPPKELVQARFDALLAGDYTPQTEPASPAPAAPAPAPQPAPAAPARKKADAWFDATKDYLANVTRTQGFATAKKLTEHLHDIAGDNTPFRRSNQVGKLFVDSVGKPIADSTIEKKWGEIRALANRRTPD